MPVEGIPRHAFSDIWSQNKGFRLRLHLQHHKYFTDLISPVFYRMPFQDRLRTAISKVLCDFWSMLGPFGPPFGCLLALFSAIFLLMNFFPSEV